MHFIQQTGVTRFERIYPNKRGGNVVILLCFLLPSLFGLIALSVDYGFLLYVRTDLQRVADAASLAAVRDLEPAADGSQDLDQVRATLREYVELNAGPGFSVLDSDIQIGRFDPSTIYDNLTILDTGIFDTVQVTIRRNDLANTSVSLFFARLLGSENADVSVTATAVLQKAKLLEANADILPMALPLDVWLSLAQNEPWSIYSDGRIADANGNEIPGNWGTLDIGDQSNSSSDLVDQIQNGLRQEDLDALHGDGTIPTNDHLDSQDPINLNGDTGLSAGLRSAIQDNHGATKLVPIFDSLTGHGGNLEFHIVGWGVVEIVDSHWQGNHDTSVVVKKSYMYDGDLRPHSDLGNTDGVIDAAYTSPVLVE